MSTPYAQVPARPLLDVPTEFPDLAGNLRQLAQKEVRWLVKEWGLDRPTPRLYDEMHYKDSLWSFERMYRYGRRSRPELLAILSRFCAAGLPQLVDGIIRHSQPPPGELVVHDIRGRLALLSVVLLER
ncbi:hypothetical protein CALCODRAFT_522061 [Calocera cornea HHB12733]|uniref:Uncharacterized protein n=1 Tax=Calocera cornea HHB12733 TaxID=1353952 RepID=A0A165C4V6_9BASI|nr:hypothetical protein CALCODRAFT_522061 [Calocera cornea HHB12733]